MLDTQTLFNELQLDSAKNLLYKAYAQRVSLEAELLKINKLLPTLTASEEDKKKKIEFEADLETAQSDLEGILVDIEVFESLVRKYHLE